MPSPAYGKIVLAWAFLLGSAASAPANHPIVGGHGPHGIPVGAMHPIVGGHGPHGIPVGAMGPIFPMPMIPYYMGPYPAMMPSFPVWMPAWSPPSSGDDLSWLPEDLRSPPPSRVALRGHDAYVTSVAFSPDGSTLGSGSSDKTVILWDVATRREKARLQGHRDRISSLAFSPDGGTLATASADRSVILWDLTNNRPRVTLRDHKSMLNAVAFGPEGDVLATGGQDGRIMIWDMATNGVRTTIEGRRGPVRELVFTPDGATVAAGVFLTTVVTWDASTGQLQETRKAWHNNETTSAASQFGNILLALARGRDGTIWLNDVKTRLTLGYLRGHHGAVRSMALGPGATLLASGGQDKLVRIWDLRDELDRWSRIEALIEEQRIENERRKAARRRSREKERGEDK